MHLTITSEDIKLLQEPVRTVQNIAVDIIVMMHSSILQAMLVVMIIFIMSFKITKKCVS